MTGRFATAVAVAAVAVCCCLGLASAHNQLKWGWMGRLTATSVELAAEVTRSGPLTLDAAPIKHNDIHDVLNRKAKNDTSDPCRVVVEFNATQDTPVKVPLTGLCPGHHYRYLLWCDTHPLTVGGFHTPTEGPLNFTLAFGSCSETGSDSQIFLEIAATHPWVFLHLGDLGYADISQNDRALYESAFRTNLGAHMLKNLLGRAPVAYMWDDHDFGPNNADSTNPGRPAATATYRKFVPHYDLPEKTMPEQFPSRKSAPIFQAFTIGGVRIIMTDLVSQRDPVTKTDGPKSILGAAQKQWFFRELENAKRDNLTVLWASTQGWIGEKKWGQYPEERAEIAAKVTELGMAKHMMILSGDAHMLAFDDGSNSAGGIPVAHAAPFDAPPSTKGGPYSHGKHPGRNQYGLIVVTHYPEDNKVCLEYRGMKLGHEVVIKYNTCHPERSIKAADATKVDSNAAASMTSAPEVVSAATSDVVVNAVTDDDPLPDPDA